MELGSILQEPQDHPEKFLVQLPELRIGAHPAVLTHRDRMPHHLFLGHLQSAKTISNLATKWVTGLFMQPQYHLLAIP